MANNPVMIPMTVASDAEVLPMTLGVAIDGGGGGGGTVDPSLSPTSTNPVQNKAIYSALNGLKDDLNHLGSSVLSKLSNWVIGGLNTVMTGTNTATNRARIPSAYLTVIPTGGYLCINIPNGYKCRAAVYNSRSFSDIVTIITDGSTYSSTNVTIPTEYIGKYLGIVVGKTDDSDFTEEEVTALTDAIYIVVQSVVGNIPELQTNDKNTIVRAVNENHDRLPDDVFNWHNFATITYPTGWQKGSWTDSGSHNTGSGNAIHLIRMLDKTDLQGVQKLKLEWTGNYTASVKVFLRTSPSTLYARYDVSSGSIINIDNTLDAFYGITLAGFGTGAQTALDNNYPDNILITKYMYASDGIVKRFKNRDSDFFTVSINSTYPSGNTDLTETTTVDCVLRLPSTYSPTGVPTKLIFMHHGNSGTVNAENETWYSESNVWINFVNAYLEAGYAVFDVNGCGGVSDPNASHDYAAFGALEAAFKAYQYIVTNYNIKPNILVHGSSMGGATAYAFAKSFGNIVDAVGLFSPALLSRSAQMSSVDDYIAVNYGYTDVAAMVADNYMRLVPSSPTIEYYADGIKTTKAYTYDWVNEHDTDGLDIVCKDFNMPVKIWCGTADTSVDPKYGEELAKAITNAGGMALFRPITGGVHSACVGGDATVNAEAVMWFDRFR